jgi:hypothetical protein
MNGGSSRRIGSSVLVGLGCGVVILAALSNYLVLLDYGDDTRGSGSRLWNGVTFGHEPETTVVLVVVVAALGVGAAVLRGRGGRCERSPVC